MNILITDGIDQTAILKLNELGHSTHEQHYTCEELKIAICDYDAIIIRSATVIDKSIIDSSKISGKLKLIIRGGIGLDNVDAEYAQRNNISVYNTPNSSSRAVAELALSHIFVLSRYLHLSNLTMRQGEWNKSAYKGQEIRDKTLGLIGFGRIARELADMAFALGMNVIYTNRSGEKKEYPKYRYVHFNDLLESADYISVHMPFSKGDKPILSKDEFVRMKKHSYVINTSRGGLIDEGDLLEALEKGQIAGAGLDVFTDEPCRNKELLNHPMVSSTPHIGGSTNEAQYKIGNEIVEIIRNWR